MTTASRKKKKKKFDSIFTVKFRWQIEFRLFEVENLFRNTEQEAAAYILFRKKKSELIKYGVQKCGGLFFS